MGNSNVLRNILVQLTLFSEVTQSEGTARMHNVAMDLETYLICKNLVGKSDRVLARGRNLHQRMFLPTEF